MVCPHGQGEEVKAVRTFFRQGGGVNFSRFCADVFYGRSLTNTLILFIVEKDQTAPFFASSSAIIDAGGTKIVFALERKVPIATPLNIQYRTMNVHAF